MEGRQSAASALQLLRQLAAARGAADSDGDTVVWRAALLADELSRYPDADVSPLVRELAQPGDHVQRWLALAQLLGSAPGVVLDRAGAVVAALTVGDDAEQNGAVDWLREGGRAVGLAPATETVPLHADPRQEHVVVSGETGPVTTPDSAVPPVLLATADVRGTRCLVAVDPARSPGQCERKEHGHLVGVDAGVASWRLTGAPGYVLVDGEASRGRVAAAAQVLWASVAVEALGAAHARLAHDAREESTEWFEGQGRLIDHASARVSLMEQRSQLEAQRAVLLHTVAHVAEAPKGQGAARRDLLAATLAGWAPLGAAGVADRTVALVGDPTGTIAEAATRSAAAARAAALTVGPVARGARSLFFDRVGGDQGRALLALLADVRATSEELGDGALVEERDRLAEGLQDVQQMLGSMAALLRHRSGSGVHLVEQNTVEFMQSLGDLLAGWLLVRQADVALEELPSAGSGDESFYAASAYAARWFCTRTVPMLRPRRERLAETETDLVDLDVESL